MPESMIARHDSVEQVAILVVGHQSMGINSIKQRFIESGIRNDYGTRIVEVGGKQFEIELRVFDAFNKETKSDVKTEDIDGVAFVFDITCGETLEYIKQVQQQVSFWTFKPGAARILIGNQISKTIPKAISNAALELAEQTNMLYVNTDIGSNDGITKTFAEFVHVISVTRCLSPTLSFPKMDSNNERLLLGVLDFAQKSYQQEHKKAQRNKSLIEASAMRAALSHVALSLAKIFVTSGCSNTKTGNEEFQACIEAISEFDKEDTMRSSNIAAVMERFKSKLAVSQSVSERRWTDVVNLLQLRNGEPVNAAIPLLQNAAAQIHGKSETSKTQKQAAGRARQLPSLNYVQHYMDYAAQQLEPNSRDYYFRGTGDELTMRWNTLELEKIKLKPRNFRGEKDMNMQTTILNGAITVHAPIGIAPTGLHQLAHPDGEKATAKAAAAQGLLMIHSCFSSTSIEDVARTSDGKGVLMQQVYFFENLTLTLDLVRRAERAGYKAIVVTIDSAVEGKMNHNPNRVQLHRTVRIKNIDGMSAEEERNLPEFRDPRPPPFDPNQSWEYIKWLSLFTRLPIIAKGILTVDDAKEALRYGVSAMIVSNSGGRQLDGAPASIAVLESIVKAVKGRCDVWMDSGIRSGTDIFKAIALGAKMVFIGRPILCGLVVNGHEGVQDVTEILRKELEATMALTGCPSLGDISKEYLQ